jgi:hypothetical protein
MPKRNQKVMSDEELSTIKEGKTKKIERDKHDIELIEKKKIEIAKQESKKLPAILQEKTSELAELIADDDVLQIPYQRIIALISSNHNMSVKVSYTNDELNIAFNEFRLLLAKLSEKMPNMTPSIEMFCAYIGISTGTYKSWRNSSDEMRREVMNRIDDYIVDTSLHLSVQKKTDNYTTVFRAKAQHGMVEQSAPIIVEHRTAPDRNEMLDKISGIREKYGIGKVVDADFKEKK